MDAKEALGNWKELTRRLDAIATPHADKDGIVRLAIPEGDPTGFLELAQTMRREQIRVAQELQIKFPFFESLFCPLFDREEKWLEADTAVARLIDKGREFVKALERGVDYEFSTDMGGEVMIFHFQDKSKLEQFRLALGLDVDKGFVGWIDSNYPRKS